MSVYPFIETLFEYEDRPFYWNIRQDDWDLVIQGQKGRQKWKLFDYT